jgi:hypothetical protein
LDILLNLLLELAGGEQVKLQNPRGYFAKGTAQNKDTLLGLMALGLVFTGMFPSIRDVVRDLPIRYLSEIVKMGNNKLSIVRYWMLRDTRPDANVQREIAQHG